MMDTWNLFLHQGWKKDNWSPSYPTHTTKVKPQKSLDQTEILLTLEEPFPKPSHHEFRAFRDWLILALDEAKAITA